MLRFRFVDLFAGIGGFRLGFESIGGECVWTSEWHPYSRQTYVANFGEQHPVEGDITKIDAASIPDHDVLLAGFPCQPFSIAGVSKKNAIGQPHGFDCTTQGTLFFDVERIIREKQPAAFVLENVKNLKSHDRGRTYDVIMSTLRSAERLGYQYHVPDPRIIDAQHFLPQHRERIFIVGFRRDVGFSLHDLELPALEEGPRLEKILHRTDGNEPVLEWDLDPKTGEHRFFDHAKRKVQAKYTLTAHLWNYLQEYARKHRAAGNGFGFGKFGPGDIARTLSARYYKDGSEILIDQGRRIPRRLTPRECARLMGFPDTYRIPVSDTQAYRQFGNAVAVPVTSAIARHMAPYLKQALKAPGRGSRIAELARAA
jgi:DNA (cytosine-5)-methyltransferase 1